MKILFSPCHYVYDEFSGGSEPLWAFNIANSIANINPDSVVVTGFKKLLEEKKYKIIEVQPDKKKIDISIKNAIFFSIEYFLETRKILKNNTFNIIHHVLPFSIGNTFNFNFIFNNKKLKLVIGPIQSPLTYKDDDVNLEDVRSNNKKNSFNSVVFKGLYFFIHPILKYLSNLTLKMADAIVVINEHTKNILIKNKIKPEKIHIISPGIDTNKFEYVPYNNKKTQKIELLVVSYLLKRKGVDLIVKAIKEVVKYNNGIVLRIVGDGPQRQNLENLVKELKLEEFIVFEGFVNNSGVQEYYRKTHIFLSMSRDESWGQMYLEAMACGLPVISSVNNGSVCMIKDGQNGFLVGQEDFLTLSAKILKLINNPRLISRFGENARRDAENNYDWIKCIIPKYVEIYKRLSMNDK